jgi:hypothetical protein
LCIKANFIAADKETTEPFQELPFDGIMGLGFSDLSMGKGFNMIDELTAKKALPSGQISFYLTDGGDSEVTFGGFKADQLASDIVWAPVTVQSWWQVDIKDITFDNQPKNLCDGKCQVAVDTGTSMLAGPSDLVDKLTNMIDVKEDCSNFKKLPNLGFQVGDKVLNLMPDDYVDRSTSDCSFSLMALDVPPPKGPVFIFGDPFLRRFVTIFDNGNAGGPRVGFAVSNQEGGSSKADQLIAPIRGTKGKAGKPPANGLSKNSVELHLKSGFMGPGGGSSEDSDAVDDSTSLSPKPTVSPALPKVQDFKIDHSKRRRSSADEFDPAPESDFASIARRMARKFEMATSDTMADNTVAQTADDFMKTQGRAGSSLLQTWSKTYEQPGLVSIKLHREE